MGVGGANSYVFFVFLRTFLPKKRDEVRVARCPPVRAPVGRAGAVVDVVDVVVRASLDACVRVRVRARGLGRESGGEVGLDRGCRDGPLARALLLGGGGRGLVCLHHNVPPPVGGGGARGAGARGVLRVAARARA